MTDCMIVKIRLAKDTDSALFKKCFDDKEFLQMLFFEEPYNFDYYLYDGNDRIRIVFSILNDKNDFEDVGFVLFQNNGGNCFTIIGGVIPEYYNTGIGVFCAVGAITFMFSKFSCCRIIAGVFFHNIRSYKMQLALGFKKIGEQSGRHIIQLNEVDFDNPFVNRIKARIELINDIV